MWLFVFFDLPTNTKKQRKNAAQFRKLLEKDGFTMMQYSVYIRHCATKESRDVHTKRVKAFIPSEGKVSILSVTDRQYSDIINFWGKAEEEKGKRPVPQQLEIF